MSGSKPIIRTCNVHPRKEILLIYLRYFQMLLSDWAEFINNVNSMSVVQTGGEALNHWPRSLQRGPNRGRRVSNRTIKPALAVERISRHNQRALLSQIMMFDCDCFHLIGYHSSVSVFNQFVIERKYVSSDFIDLYLTSNKFGNKMCC